MKTKCIVLLIAIIIVSCSSKQNTIDEYIKYPVKFIKQKVTYPGNDFDLMIPYDWIWKVEQYDNDQIILGIDASSKSDNNGFIDIISIQKIKGIDKDGNLESEFNSLIGLIENNENSLLIESGTTDLIDKASYYFHFKSSTGTYGEMEMISFISRSNEKGVYYILTASASQTEDLKHNMAVMLQCLKTFKYNS